MRRNALFRPRPGHGITDERGFILVFFAVALPALLALVSLAVDLSRVFSLDSELAGIADSAALAAANRLDRSDAAIANAREAADALSRTATFAAADQAKVALTYRFAERLSDLRASPTYTLAEASGASAVYVEVTTAEHSIAASFIEAFGGRTTAIRRRAIAESQYYACDVTPAILCQRDPERFVATARRGRQYRLRHGDGTQDGSLLLVDAPGDAQGGATPRTLASDTPKFCFTDHITLRAAAPVPQFEDAVNLRFDRYVNAGGPIAADLAAFPPAPNIIQGQRFNSCGSPPNAADVNPPYHLPRDSAFRNADIRVPYDAGAGDWKTTPAYGGSGFAAVSALDEYLAWNHSDKSNTFQGSLRQSETRYDLYLKELSLPGATDATPLPRPGQEGTMPTGGPKSGPLASLAEKPTPTCYPGRRDTVDARRRILYLAVVDCGAFAENATAAKLSLNVGKFFLTEPVNRNFAYLEFLNMVRPTTDDGRLRHIVQLVEAN